MSRYLIFFAISIFFGCVNNSQNVHNQSTKEYPKIDIESEMSIMDIIGKYEKIKFVIPYDFEVKQKKEYLGIKTKTFFLNLIQQYQIDTSKFDVTFICKDGYSPTIPLNQLLMENAYIAVKDVAAKGDWADSVATKFSPAYLVWDIPINDHKHSFPFGITSIKFVQKKEEYLHARPLNDNPDINKGFAIFKEKCIKCHAINQEGGILGPELNYPKNITEYWKIDQLKIFIKNPSDIRHNSKMPQITELNEAELNLIIKYFEFMATQKISNN